MKSFVAKRFQSVSGGLSLDTEALSRYSDIIDLSIGDTDFITDDRIIDAAFSDARLGYTKYGDPKGDPELIDAVIKAYKEDFSVDISRESVVVTASSCMGMGLAMLALLDPGDEVIVFSPYFTMYRSQIELAGGVCVEVPTYESEGYAIAERRLRTAITPKTKAIIFNNPTNPTGAAYGIDTLRLLIGIAEEYDLLIVADEIYTRYMFTQRFTPICSLPGALGRTVTLNSFSKNFMMTGWRIGYIIASADIVTAIMQVNNSLVYSAPAPSQRAAIKALELREDIQQRYITQYRERVFYAYERISKIPYLSMQRPGGTFYVFPSIKKTGLTSAEFCALLLDKCHILATPGSAFGAAGEGHIRLVCACGKDTIKEAFDRMERLSF